MSTLQGFIATYLAGAEVTEHLVQGFSRAKVLYGNRGAEHLPGFHYRRYLSAEITEYVMSQPLSFSGENSKLSMHQEYFFLHIVLAKQCMLKDAMH